jgi:3-hydroxyacyl-[acyl-carrier-protein] dehydratase
MRYFFVDQIMEMALGEHIIAKKNITASEDCFSDHFPGFPVYPGALLLETMAQVGGLLIEKTVTQKEGRRILPTLSIVRNAKFRHIVLPGDTLIVDVKLENYTETAAGMCAEIRCAKKRVANADLFFTLLDVKKGLDIDSLPEVDTVQDTLARISDIRAQQNKLEVLR